MNALLATVNAKYIHTNLALRYIKAYAQPEFDLELVEYTLKDTAMNIVSDLYQRKPDVVMFSTYIWNVTPTLEILDLFKKVWPDALTVVGGPEVSFDVRERLLGYPQIDVICMREGELTTKLLLEALRDGKPLSTVPGIAYREEGQVVVNPSSGYLDLSSIKSPYRFPEDILHLPKRITYVETSRGCPFSCQFCLSSIEHGMRYFDIDWIKGELRYLMEHGAKVIKFLDRTFNTNKKYAMEIFRFLIDEHRPGCVFQFEITADIMPPDIIEFLNEHAPPGLFRFEIGVQSTNDLTNDIIKRRQNFGKLSHIVNLIEDGGKIDQHLDLIAGLPEENYLSFKKTFNDVFALRPEELQLGFLKMLRGTGLRARAAQHGYVYMDHPPYEILQNDVLSFEDGVRLRQTEDVLEKYWNDHRMDLTVEYLVANVFDSPFEFFQDFGTYWEARGWSRIGHQLPDLFRRLHDFLKDRGTPDLDVVLGIMKVDYLSGQKLKPKIWWKSAKTSPSLFYGELVGNPGILGAEYSKAPLSLQELHKHTLVEELPFDYSHFKSTGRVLHSPKKILFYFSPSERKCLVYEERR
ncbi:MAG: B12-binding domain-containing radical SAM protein [Turicibacter sp.]|nr:B12-binding domain-containing radical SAM protein [Turicibacter sp.]